MKKNKSFLCVVSWKNIDLEDKSDIEDQELFQKSIIGYVNTFNSLPPVGLIISNLSCDPGKIEEVTYCGINNSILVELNFE
jgi:hypothetical protein